MHPEMRLVLIDLRNGVQVKRAAIVVLMASDFVLDNVK
jgi:hypothetical protein